MSRAPLSFAERRDWLRLYRTHTVGPVAFWSLMTRYRAADAALDALPTLIRRKDVHPPSLEQVEAEMDASEAVGVRIICAVEPDFPDLLRALDPAPPLISVWGDIELSARPCVAIVGSRNASALGQKFAAQMAGELGDAGFTVVSGLARGIDAAAHAAALDTGTIGVLGGGVDHIYPRQNTDLHLAMRERGLLVSESPLGYRATARDFPRRNRLISGLSLGVVVVEAAERSGTLITARYALEQNREVMAAPGSPLDPRTKGCNRLIRQGAALIESSQDILDCLEAARADVMPDMLFDPAGGFDMPDFNESGARTDIDRAREALLQVTSFTATHRDDLIRAASVPTGLAGAALLEMELNGDIVVNVDGRVSRAR
ncbi:DNA-processing protein DprA [Algimonas porphyrae]|uniref:DNA processing protein DprA n=1 Tax=Algimonas porphyrae TaxID=1128113 RepID=A0ABQ5V3C4_9PROT|nr:DNA-processing protein DprA [Algimonas porphyrae]GLQ21338.1 DNA processing protein DprA [Algimonas porphyrae]